MIFHEHVLRVQTRAIPVADAARVFCKCSSLKLTISYHENSNAGPWNLIFAGEVLLDCGQDGRWNNRFEAARASLVSSRLFPIISSQF